MTANEVTEIIKALAPAGEAVHQTATLYLINEIGRYVVTAMTIVATVIMVTRFFLKWQQIRVDEDQMNELRGVLQANKRTLESPLLTTTDSYALEIHLDLWSKRHAKEQIGPFGNIRYVKHAKVEELIKFLGEN